MGDSTTCLWAVVTLLVWKLELCWEEKLCCVEKLCCREKLCDCCTELELAAW